MIRFGPSGHSASFYADGNKRTAQAAEWLKRKGLDAYEYSFGRGVNMGCETALAVGAEMTRCGIAVSCHAPYYINLANESAEEIAKSFSHVEKSVRTVELMGGRRTVFHPGYAGSDRRGSMNRTLRNAEALLGFLDAAGLKDYTLCPESMGKKSQLGSYEEICEICRVSSRFIPAYDWGHINCFTGGGLKTEGDYRGIIDYTFARVGAERARSMHMHFSKIQYGDKGEIRHLNLDDKIYGPDFAPLAAVIKEYKMEPVVICESSENMAEDALQLKRIYDTI